MQLARNGIRAAALFALMLCFALLALPHTAMATSVKTPDATESADAAIKDLSKDTTRIFGDVVSAGQNVTINKLDIPSNLIGAAQSINVTNVNVGADAILAGSSVTVDEVMVGNNVFAACESFTNKGKVAGSVNAVARTIFLGGAASSANVMGETVTIDGVFTGDVTVTAQNVVIGDNAVVKGTLSVEAQDKPTVPPGADVADLKFKQSTANADATVASAELAAFLASMSFFFIIMGIIGSIILVVFLLALCTDKPFVDAGFALRERPARVLLTGFLAMLIVPIAVIILFALGIGWQIALVILLICGVLSLVSETFTALALGYLIFKNMNRWGAGILAALILAILSVIPFLGVVVGIFCSMYMVGYVCTRYFDWRKGRKIQNRGSQPAQASFAATPQPEPVAYQASSAATVTSQAPVAGAQAQPEAPQAQGTAAPEPDAGQQPPVNNA